MTSHHRSASGSASGSASNKKQTKLIFSGQPIHSLAELRAHFQLEAALTAWANGTLRLWLMEHHHDQEAQQLSQLSITDSNYKKRFCQIFGVNDELSLLLNEPPLQLTPEQKIKLARHRDQVRPFTSDATLLAKAQRIALNQEQLLALLDAGATEVYLCHNRFYIPLRKPNIHYIGIDHPQIEKPYTREQYASVGITLEQIHLPEQTAVSYENLSPNHPTPLTVALQPCLHRRIALNDRSLTDQTLSDHSLPMDPMKPVGHPQTDPSDVDDNTAVQAALRQIYDRANQSVSPEASSCVSRELAMQYSQQLNHCFYNLTDKLQRYCLSVNRKQVWLDLLRLIQRSQRSLEQAFEDELTANIDYYRLTPFHYFMESFSCDSNSCQSNPYESDSSQSVASKADTIVREMEQDWNERMATFYEAAYQIYGGYVQQLEALLDHIGQSMPPLEADEPIHAYLDRICMDLPN